MKNIKAIIIASSFLLLAGFFSLNKMAFGAFPITLTGQGGTGSTSPSGILYGDNNTTNSLKTVTIGSNLTFSGGTLSATGDGAGNPDFTYNTDIGFGVTGSATSTKTHFTAGVHASGTSQLGTASSTLQTIADALWLPFHTSAILLSDANGKIGEYTGTTCTNQFVRALSALGVATCESVNLASDVTGTLTVARGGTGQTSFGQGWLHSDGTTLTSSTSPTVAYLTATSTTATSTFAGGMNVAGSAGLTVLQNGNVGIGTATPNALLHVAKSTTGGFASIFENDNTGTGAWSSLEVRNESSGDSSTRINTLGTGWTTNGAYVQDGGALEAGANLSGGLALISRHASGNMRFYTGGFADSNERMRILSGGNVGIGETAPGSKLSVSGGGSFGASYDTTAAPANGLIIEGNVGIGTTSPAAELEVGNSTDGGIASIVTNSNGGTAADAEVQARNGYVSGDAMRMIAIGTGYTTNGAFVQDSGVLVAGGNLSGGLSVVARGASAPMRFYTGGFADSKERLRIDSSGNIGIGEAVPALKLDISNSSAGANVNALGVSNPNGTAGTAVSILLDPNGAADYVRAARISSTQVSAGNEANLQFHVNNGGELTAMTIDKLGKVGIGTTSPWRTLSINGTGAWSGLTAAAGTPNTLCVNATTKEIYENSATSCVVSSRQFKKEIFSINETIGFTATSTYWKRNATTTKEEITLADGTSSTTGITTIIYEERERKDTHYSTTTPYSVLDKIISKLNPVAYVMKDGNDPQVGFIAEEVEAIEPRLVARDIEGNPWSVRYEQLTAYIVKGMQEILAKITGMEQKIKDLENKNAILESRLNALELRIP